MASVVGLTVDDGYGSAAVVGHVNRVGRFIDGDGHRRRAYGHAGVDLNWRQVTYTFPFRAFTAIALPWLVVLPVLI